MQINAVFNASSKYCQGAAALLVQKMPEPVAADKPQLRGAAKLITFSEVRSTLAAACDYGFGKSRLIGINIILLLIMMIAAAWWVFSSRATFRYTTMPVTRGAVIHMVTGSGTVNPELAIIVGTYVSGVIQELHCDYNTAVKKGQLCAKIDPRPFQTVVDQGKANLLAAKAQLEKDKASLTYAKLSFDRAAQLVGTNAVSQDAFDIAKSTYEQAQTQIALDEATIEQRQAELASAQVNLDYTDIVSPVDGVVVSRNVTMGETVAATYQTPTLFLIATDLTKMEVDTNVSESDVGGLKEGDNATFTVDAFPKRTFRGIVSQVRQ
jgi:HlyD family secretion protein